MKLTPQEKKMVQTTFEACASLKALDIILVDLSQSETYTDWVFIVSSTNDRQARAIADRVIESVYTECQINPLGVEGYEGAQWILVDFGSLVCHVFLQELRDHYHLEDMWPRVRPLKEAEISDSLNPPKKKRTVAPKKKTPVKKIKIRKKTK